MQKFILGLVLLAASISAHATTWRELATARPEGQITKPVTPCHIAEEDPTIYHCIGFRLDGESFVAILMEPKPDSEILTILTTPSSEYPDGYVNPQDLIDNVGSAI